jgi:hypothetical protein
MKESAASNKPAKEIPQFGHVTALRAATGRSKIGARVAF